MNKQLLFVSLFLVTLLLPGYLLAADNTMFPGKLISLILHGKVYDDSTGAPIKDHIIMISNDLGYSKSVRTGIDGNYGDTINGLPDSIITIRLATLDCKGLLHTSSVLSRPSLAIVNFAICGPSIPVPAYNIGGLVFAGNFPINNPEHSGDTGVAYLYRKAGSNVILIDTTRFTQYGYFAFIDLIPGEYKVKVSLTTGSEHYNDFIPAWYFNEIQWKSGNIINVIDTNIYNVNISLVEKPGYSSGQGKIGGYVMTSESDAVKVGGIYGAEVILYSSNGIPLDFRMTDTGGNFEFNDLPLGDYRLFTEFPGKYSLYTNLSVTSSNMILENVKLELFSNDIIGIDENEVSNEIGNIFPNPAKDKFQIKLNLFQQQKLNFRIYSSNGVEISDETDIYEAGSSVISIHTETYTKGIYLLIISTEDGKIVKCEKFIRN